MNILDNSFCYNCRRNGVLTCGTCWICYYNPNDYLKKKQIDYNTKLKNFKLFLIKLNNNINFLSPEYDIPNSDYKTMINYIPIKKRKSHLLVQRVFKNIKKDYRFITNDMIKIFLKYYYFYMLFLEETKKSLSNIKFMYYVIEKENLDYKVFFNLTKKDLSIMKLFDEFLDKNYPKDDIKGVDNGYIVDE